MVLFELTDEISILLFSELFLDLLQLISLLYLIFKRFYISEESLLLLFQVCFVATQF